jgi:hypothetical protein
MSVESYLEAMSYIEKGDWEASHRLIQKYHNQPACWIHAHLHRAEGDLWNARYWYERAVKKMPKRSLAEELKQIKSFVLTEKKR